MDVFFVVRTSVEIGLIFFHASVFACIIRERRQKHVNFVKPFYTLYLLQSVADYGSFAVSTVLQRLAQHGLVRLRIYDTWFGTLVPFTMAYLIYFEFLTHAAIAINRWSVLSSVAAHAVSVDEGPHAKYGMTALFLLPMPGAALRIFVRMTSAPSAANGVGTVPHALPWMFAMTQIASLLYGASTAFVSIYFELRSLLLYKRLSSRLQEAHRNDFLLLVYALLQFCGHFAFCAYFALTCYGTLTDDALLGLVPAIQAAYPCLTDSFALSAPVCLFFTSQQLRDAYRKAFWWPRASAVIRI